MDHSKVAQNTDEMGKYQPMEITKNDWKLYRNKIGGWQEAYMEKLCEEYAALLGDDSIKASERFWALEQRIRENKRKPGVQVQMSKSNMLFDVARLITDSAITIDDLSEFSLELREAVKRIIDSYYEIEGIAPPKNN